MVREIHSRSLGHVPIIDPASRGRAVRDARAMEKKARQQIAWESAEARRLAQRSSCERVNSQLKDQFGILALTVDHLTRLVA